MEAQHAETLAKAHHAADPDDPRKPAHIWQVPRDAWWYAIRRSVHNFLVDIDTDVAATLTYFAVMSLFPGLLAFLTLLTLFGQGQATADWIVTFLARHFDAGVAELLREPIVKLTQNGAAGWVLAFSLALALWGAAGYVGAFGRALNHVYDVAEGRPIWVMIPYNLLLTALTIVMGILGMLAVLFSSVVAQTLGDALGIPDETVQFWSIVRWPILIAAAIIYLALLYYATPNVKVKLRLITPGTCLALGVMTAVVSVFNFYVANWGTWDETYGVVGSVIVLLLGLWISNIILIFAGELDAELERVRQLLGGIEAEGTIQLPPRDDRIIREVIAAEARFVEQGRELRERHAGLVPTATSAAKDAEAAGTLPERAGSAAETVDAAGAPGSGADAAGAARSGADARAVVTSVPADAAAATTPGSSSPSGTDRIARASAAASKAEQDGPATSEGKAATGASDAAGADQPRRTPRGMTRRVR